MIGKSADDHEVNQGFSPALIQENIEGYSPRRRGLLILLTDCSHSP